MPTDPKKTKPSTFLGMPMQWDYKNWRKDVWNRDDPRLFPPKRVGIGWGINFHALLKKLEILKR